MSTIKKQLLEAVAAVKPGRSAWSRGVKAYAVELVEGLEPANADFDLSSERLLEKALLNGADNWRQYSEGGCALIWDADIAERLCSPSELKRVRGGERAPNSRENWLEVQARALWQAHRLIEKEWRKLERGEK